MGRRAGAAVLCLAIGQSAAAQDRPPAEPTEAAAAAEGLKTGPATIPAHWSKNPYPESIPEGQSYYIVERGDTLWGISARFMKSPYLWPQVWEANKYIKDAHWIYPGDPVVVPVVALVSDKAGEPPPVEPPPPPPPPAPARPADVLVPATTEMSLQCASAIVDGREDEDFFIIGSEEGARRALIFANRDIVYLNRGSSAGVKPGDVYSIHHASYPVKHPVTHRRIGQKVETLGWLRVILVTDSAATAVIEQACTDVHLGDYLKPFEKVTVPMLVRRPPADRLTPPTGKSDGAVVDIEGDAGIAGTGQIATINLGTRNGVAAGNMLTVYRVMFPSVPTPRVVVGELAVLAVREKTSLVAVTYSTDGILPGDRVELQ